MTSFTSDCDRTGSEVLNRNVSDASTRLHIHNLLDTLSNSSESDGQDVIAGLTHTPKYLPPKYFYDRLGSDLFEQICSLPEYYPTRTEASIFQQQARAIAQLTGPCELVELGSGSATKTRILLDAYQAEQLPLRYIPVDVSGSMLQESSHQLLTDYPDLKIHGLISTYEPALEALPISTLPARMVMFIGSTLGNLSPYECEQFLAQIGAALTPGQYFLLGLDLQKEIEVVEAAYNDSQGVTAMFNLNMLRHLNHRFQGDFSLADFKHVAFYNQEKHQIEMHLESMRQQTVHLKCLNLSVEFSQGERLLSEISRKFDPAQMEQQLAYHGLSVLKTFTDERRWFGLMLAQKKA